MKARTKQYTFTVPTGSAATGYEARAEFGKEFQRCLGYYAVVLSNGGIIPEACKVSFTNSAETVVDKVALGHYLLDKTVAIKDRFFKEEPFTLDSGSFNLRVETPAVTASPLMIQFLFIVGD